MKILLEDFSAQVGPSQKKSGGEYAKLVITKA
jgi:hypothetical protein